MNASRILSTLTVATALTIVSGCGQQEQPAATTASTPAAAPATPATPTAPVVPVAPASSAAADASTTAATQAQGVLDKAKSLVDSGKYADASKLLQELSSVKLTPEQQKMLDDLKAAVQKNLAGSALGGMLNK